MEKWTLRGQSEHCVGKANLAWAKRTVHGQSGHSRGHGMGKADSAWTKWAFAWTVAIEKVGSRDWRTMGNKNSPLYNSHVCVYSVHNFFFRINYIVVK